MCLTHSRSTPLCVCLFASMHVCMAGPVCWHASMSACLRACTACLQRRNAKHSAGLSNGGWRSDIHRQHCAHAYRHAHSQVRIHDGLQAIGQTHLHQTSMLPCRSSSGVTCSLSVRPHQTGSHQNRLGKIGPVRHAARQTDMLNAWRSVFADMQCMHADRLTC